MNLVNTPYDDVFRTLLNDCTQLVIPIINEIFNEDYSGNENIIFYPNEHFLNQQDGKELERITDTCFVIQGRELKKYHLECQSTADSSMLVRIFEYDAQIALDAGIIEGDTLTVKFPNSAILFLRCTSSTPDKMRIQIETPGGNFGYGIPVMKAQRYTIDEIFQKNLLFLIPFYIFTHESRFPEYNKDNTGLKNLMAEYEDIKNRLEALCRNGEINEYIKCTINDMANKVLEHISKDYAKVWEGVKSVMGGKVLDYEAKTIKNEGIQEGKLETILEFVRDGIITLSDAANRLSMTEDELKAYIK